MSIEESQAQAYMILVARMPPSWIERYHPDGRMQMTPRAVRLRDAIAEVLRKAYSAGLEYGLENHS